MNIFEFSDKNNTVSSDVRTDTLYMHSSSTHSQRTSPYTNTQLLVRSSEHGACVSGSHDKTKARELELPHCLVSVTAIAPPQFRQSATASNDPYPLRYASTRLHL